MTDFKHGCAEAEFRSEFMGEPSEPAGPVPWPPTCPVSPEWLRSAAACLARLANSAASGVAHREIYGRTENQEYAILGQLPAKVLPLADAPITGLGLETLGMTCADPQFRRTYEGRFNGVQVWAYHNSRPDSGGDNEWYWSVELATLPHVLDPQNMLAAYRLIATVRQRGVPREMREVIP